ncbi:MAG TPA: hypothetical protein DCR93_33345 [Cytophagales bacterium]|nr:hypothetical protein [Cytophagales bacterium]
MEMAILVAALADYFPLLDSNLTLNIIVREHMADRAVELSQRHLLHLTGTSKERYQYVMENNPRLHERLPLHLIASMIGITPTQLSRIRGQR